MLRGGLIGLPGFVADERDEAAVDGLVDGMI